MWFESGRERETIHRSLQVGGDPSRSSRDLEPRDPDHRVPGAGEEQVPVPVVLGLLPSRVVGPPVDLDDQAGRGPAEVGFDESAAEAQLSMELRRDDAESRDEA